MYGYPGWSQSDFDDVFSSDRLGTYLTARGGNKNDALALYAWNIAISNAMFAVICGVEIALRNACHRELSAYLSLTWYDTASFLSLDVGFAKEISKVKSRIRADGKSVTPGRVVAGLTFGFWANLFGKRYRNSLWVNALNNAVRHYPPPQKRTDINAKLKKINRLRNRIAHHEPIFSRSLKDDFELLKEVAGWLSPFLPPWLQYHNRCENLLLELPLPHQKF